MFMVYVGRVDPEYFEHPVPEEIQLLNVFLNTLDLQTFGEHGKKPEEERDEFRTPGTLRSWLVEHGLLGRGEPVTDEGLALAKEMRGALRAAASERSEKRHLPGATPSAFEQVPLFARLRDDGRPDLISGRDGVPGALGKLLSNAVVAAARGTWDRLKVCAAEDCRWVYYDHSKSRTGRWCSMQTCGNRVKTKRYRQRRRSTRKGP